jgi:ADP-ribose pyrophosphatase YjhB (NUDIX family)
MADGRIRVVALAVVRRPVDGAVLAIRYGEGRTYYRPPGGGVEFSETAVDAVQREMMEELGHRVRVERLLGVVENIYVDDGVQYHQIMFNWLVHFEDERLYTQEDFHIHEDNGEEYYAHWVRVDELARAGIPFYPEALAGLIGEIAA